MATIAHRELRNNSSEILRRVIEGESFEITNNGKVVAELSPPSSHRLAGMRYRPAKIHGRFDEVPLVDSPLSVKQIMDELKGDL